MEPNAAVDEWLERIRAYGRDATTATAKEAEGPVLEAARATAAAGQTPDGHAWAPRKADGGRALEHAADAITVKAYGPTLRISLSGFHVYQHHGAGKRLPARRIIPTLAIPPRVLVALQAAAKRVFARFLAR